MLHALMSLSQINYLNIADTIKKQREAVFAKIKTISNSHIIRPGITFAEPITAIPIESIPGVKVRDREGLSGTGWSKARLIDVCLLYMC